MLAALPCARAADAAWPGRIEGVRSDWSASAPTDDGRVDVTLPDNWSTRWPDFDGVVWYRLTWTTRAPVEAAGLFIE